MCATSDSDGVGDDVGRELAPVIVLATRPTAIMYEVTNDRPSSQDLFESIDRARDQLQ